MSPLWAGIQPPPFTARGPGAALAPGSQPSGRMSAQAGRCLEAAKLRSHVRRRKAAEFWYCCCSWCCESGRRAAHPLTRLFHDTRVASYPFSPGEPRGTQWTRTRTRGEGGKVCELVLFSPQDLSQNAPGNQLGNFPKVRMPAPQPLRHPRPANPLHEAAESAFVRGSGVMLKSTCSQG